MLKLSALWSCKALSLSERTHLWSATCRPRHLIRCHRNVCGGSPIVRSGFRIHAFHVVGRIEVDDPSADELVTSHRAARAVADVLDRPHLVRRILHIQT